MITLIAIVLLCACIIIMAAGTNPKNWAVVGIAVVALLLVALSAAGVFK